MPDYEAPDLAFACPSCGREYSAAQARLYDPPRRPIYEGLQATVICAGRPDGTPCLSPVTESATQFEVVIVKRQVNAPAGLLNRFLRREHPTWEWDTQVYLREW